jgi:uncharacterized protein YggE
MRALVSALALLVCAGLAPANVTVTGNGKVVYVPDIGTISVGVSADGKTAAEAWDKNRDAVRRLFEALRRRGIDPKDMQTTGLNVSPKYIHRPNEEPELVGYTVSYTLRVTVRKLDQMGSVLDDLVENGANRGMNISFGCADAEKLLDEARAKAVADARKKAALYATTAGGRLGKVLTISEQSFVPVQVLSYEHRLAAADKKMPIAPGEQELSVQVHLAYALLDDAK